MKICFVSALFCKRRKLLQLDRPTKFLRNPKYDYFMFTSLPESKLDTSWDLVNIKTNENIKTMPSYLRKSRYPKFMSWHLLESMQKKYDVVFYCDAWISPNINKDWESLARRIMNEKEFPFAQTEHNKKVCREGGISAEMERILISERDTITSMNQTKVFFKNYDSSVDLNYPQYFENTCFGYAFDSEPVRKITSELWEIYKEENLVSFRDQPLWNFLLLKHGVKPIAQNDMKDNTLRLIPEYKELPFLTDELINSCWFLRKYENEGSMRENYTKDKF
jgi:hypothetical protein